MRLQRLADWPTGRGSRATDLVDVLVAMVDGNP